MPLVELQAKAGSLFFVEDSKSCFERSEFHLERSTRLQLRGLLCLRNSLFGTPAIAVDKSHSE